MSRPRAKRKYPDEVAHSACDACSRRKVKCDYADLTTMARDVRVSCTACRLHGLPCHITSNRGQRQTHAVARANDQYPNAGGRRESERQIRTEPCRDEWIVQEERQEPSLDVRTHTDAPGHTHRFEEASVEALAISAEEVATASATSSARLLGIPGLSVAILHGCVDAFFATTGSWMIPSQGELTVRTRLQHFLCSVQGVVQENSSLECSSSGTELLIVAIAARGASFTPYPQMSVLLTDHFVRLVHQGDTLTQSGMDGLEAVTILHEGFFRPLFPVLKNDSLPTCLQSDPLGKGFPAEFCLFLGLNKVSKEDSDRKTHLFWTIYNFDAIGSASACRMYRIQEDDIGWKLPAMPVNTPIIYLSLTARKICRALFSASARLQRIRTEELHKILDDLSSWPELCHLPVDNIQLMPSSPGPEESDESLTRTELMKIAFGMGMWLRLILSVWTVVQGKRSVHLPVTLLHRIEKETHSAVKRVEQLARLCIHYDLVDCGSTLLVTTFAAWTLYFVRKSLPSTRLGQRNNSPYASAHLMLNAIQSARFTHRAHFLAGSLQRMLTQDKSIGQVSVDDISQAAENGHLSAQISSKVCGSQVYPLQPQSSQFPTEYNQRHDAAIVANSSASRQLSDRPLTASLNIDTSNSDVMQDSTLKAELLAWDPDLLHFLDATMAPYSPTG